MLIPLHVFHASHFKGDSFTYRRPDLYSPKDTSIIFSQYIREKVSNQFGLDIHNCLYAYHRINDYAKENFGNETFSVSAKKEDYRAFVCKGVSDITYDLRVGSGHLLGRIYGFIDGFTYGQIPADSFVSQDMRKHFNDDENDFRSYDDFEAFLRKISDAFHADMVDEEESMDDDLYTTVMKQVQNTFKKIDSNYLPNIQEVSLPYTGKEEIMIVADELYLQKT